ncbi:hypothetical protein ABZ504_44735, partial [Streptomyces mirabilis]
MIIPFLRDEMQDAVTVTLKRVDNPAAIGKHPSAGAAFDMDPFYLFEDAPSPYAFFGINPTLFDALDFRRSGGSVGSRGVVGAGRGPCLLDGADFR